MEYRLGPTADLPDRAGVRRVKRLFSPGPSVARPVAGVERLVADLPERRITIDIKRAPRARRMTLRIPPGNANPIVTIPLRASLATVERFVRSQEAWLADRLAERAPVTAFVDGAAFPLRGERHVIRRTGSLRGGVQRLPGDPALLFVAGAEEHLARRVTDYLKAEARRDLTVAVTRFASQVNRRPAAIRIKDTRAQWGSCSPTGVLSFSWRLVLAPPFVLDYVAAHEVAHLVELNHSDAFWAVNERLDPDLDRARAWLRRNGRSLHAIGGDPE